MNKIREKLAPVTKVCKLIFGYGIMVVLFAGGLTFFGYLAALIIGGETATAMCTVIYKKIVPVIVYASTVLILFGLITMYMAGEKALIPDKKKASKEEGEK
ncbi:MAG: hypothetical protein IJU52_00325 [Clostridia bacterium]|nr:hypothetical protein [Clostridia bacterium]